MGLNALIPAPGSYTFNHFGAGYIPVTAAAAPGPDVDAQLVWLLAPSSNGGTVYVGGSDVSSAIGFPLVVDVPLGPLPAQHLSLIYFIGDNPGDEVRYMFLK